MKFLTTLILTVFFATANAHHTPDHKVFIAGEVGTGRTIMCDTKKQIQSLLVVQKTKGREAAIKLFKKYAQQKNELNEPVCGFQLFKFIVYEQVFKINVDNKNYYVVKVGVPQRDGTRLTYFILSTWDVENPNNWELKNMKYCITEKCIEA